MSGDGAFESSHFFERSEEIDSSIGIFAAEGEEVEVVVADAVAIADVFDAVFIVVDTTSTVMAEPWGVDAIVLGDAEFGEGVGERFTQAGHDVSEEVSIAGPRGVGIGSINEDGIIDVVARVDCGTGVSEGKDSAGGIIEHKAQSGEGIVGFPAGMAKELEPDVDELLRGVVERHGDAL